MCICSNCLTLKTLSRTVSVQAQLVSYKYSTQTLQQCDAKLMGTIYLALNVTQGHKRSYQTNSSAMLCQTNGHDLLGSTCHTRTQA